MAYLFIMESTEDMYVKRLKEQEAEFKQKYGSCGNRPTFYFIHFHNGRAHWSEYSVGWSLSYMNLSKGDDSTSCGGRTLGGQAVCKTCYESKKDEIGELCEKFTDEMKENFSEVLGGIKKEGNKIGITYTK